MGETVAVANQKPLSFSEQLKEVLVQNQEALPPQFNQQRFIVNALELLNSDDKLKNYPAPVLKQALLKTALLDVDATQGQVFIIPYGKTLDVQLSWTGMVRLVKKYSIRPVKEIGSEIVRDGDEFSVTVDGEDTKFVFKPKPFSDAPVIGCFAYVRFTDGGTLLERMSKSELDTVKRQSKQPNSPAWKNWETMMWRKACTKRLCRKVELDMSAYQMQLWNNDTAIRTEPEPKKVDNPFADADVVDGEVVNEVDA